VPTFTTIDRAQRAARAPPTAMAGRRATGFWVIRRRVHVVGRVSGARAVTTSNHIPMFHSADGGSAVWHDFRSVRALL